MEGGYRNIKEDYKIESTIGRGSFALVKRAKNRATQVRYAVKVLSKKKMTEEDLIGMQTEIEILKTIDHPHVVKLIDVYEDERHICLVMELMEGGELFDQILTKECFSEAEARTACKVMIEAIKYCHAHEIVHRDIKPENLLLQSTEGGLQSLKIADFGLARLLKEDSMAQTTCGTPGYVAPEVLMQRPYGKPCDYWSIGVVTFILLSGSPPFFEDGTDNFGLFEQIKKCNYNFEVETWQQVSNEAKDFITKVLVADPEIRLNFDQMLAHPWMSKDLSNGPILSNQHAALKKYVSIRKVNSQKFKKEDLEDEMKD